MAVMVASVIWGHPQSSPYRVHSELPLLTNGALLMHLSSYVDHNGCGMAFGPQVLTGLG